MGISNDVLGNVQVALHELSVFFVYFHMGYFNLIACLKKLSFVQFQFLLTKLVVTLFKLFIEFVEPI